MAHSDDVMLLADQVIRMQRTIRAVSARHGFVASFMPKPIDDEAGNDDEADEADNGEDDAKPTEGW